MREEGSSARRVVLALCLAGFAGCATAGPPPAPIPVAAALEQRSPVPDEWNIFPDPTSGNVEVYHHGEYVGAITGKEPADEDPPLPHQVEK